MPIYHPEPGDTAPETLRRRSYNSFACRLLHFGPVILYRSREILSEDLATLKGDGFEVREFSAAKWANDPRTISDDLTAVLRFPRHGGGLAGLEDCLVDTLSADIPDDAGMVVVIEDCDALARDFFRSFLDVFASAATFLQVFGKTFMVFLHSNDPAIDFGRFGGTRAHWNPREFLWSDRII